MALINLRLTRADSQEENGFEPETFTILLDLYSLICLLRKHLRYSIKKKDKQLFMAS